VSRVYLRAPREEHKQAFLVLLQEEEKGKKEESEHQIGMVEALPNIKTKFSRDIGSRQHKICDTVTTRYHRSVRSPDKIKESYNKHYDPAFTQLLSGSLKSTLQIVACRTARPSFVF